MYVNYLSNRFFLCAFVFLLFVFFLASNSYASGFMANSLDVEEGSQYNNQAVKAATLVAIVGGSGYLARSVLQLTLADGTFVYVTKALVLSADKAYGMLALCTANPVACGVIGVGLGVTAAILYLTYRNGNLIADEEELKKIAVAGAISSYPAKSPVYVSDPLTLPLCSVAGYSSLSPTLCSQSSLPCRLHPLTSSDYGTDEGGMYVLSDVIGKAIFSKNIVIVSSEKPFSFSIPPFFNGITTISCPSSSDGTYDIPFYKVKSYNGSVSKPSRLTDVYPVHSPSIVATVPQQDWVIDDSNRIFPDIYKPVAITGVEPVANPSDYPPPGVPIKYTLDTDGSVLQEPVNQPPVTLPPVVTPTYPDIPYVPSVPSIPDTSNPVDLSGSKDVIKDAVKDAVQEAQAEADEEALEDADSANSPNTNTFDIMSYLDWGDSWLPSECPQDFTLNIVGQPFNFSYSTVCQYSPSIRTFVLVSSLISFVGIVVGGLKS